MMKKIIGQIIFFELLLILGSQPFLCAEDEAKIKRVGVEGLIDLTTPWPVSNYYPEKFRMKTVVNYVDQGPATKVDYGKAIDYSSEGAFEHYYCWTKIIFRGGNVSVELRDASTDRLVAEEKKDLTLEAYFSSPTHAWSSCLPHDYPSFDRNVSFVLEPPSLAISERRSLVVRPFIFCSVEEHSLGGHLIHSVLYGRAHVEKENGVYILKSLDLTEALNAEALSSESKRMTKTWLRVAWDHYQMGQLDSHGYLWGTANHH